MAPNLFAAEIITDQTERSEVADDVFSLAGGCGRRGAAISAVKSFELFRFDAVGPKQMAIARVIRLRQQFTIGKRRDEDAILPYAGR